jgi:hypothetical protein
MTLGLNRRVAAVAARGQPLVNPSHIDSVAIPDLHRRDFPRPHEVQAEAVRQPGRFGKLGNRNQLRHFFVIRTARCSLIKG